MTDFETEYRDYMASLNCDNQRCYTNNKRYSFCINCTKSNLEFLEQGNNCDKWIRHYFDKDRQPTLGDNLFEMNRDYEALICAKMPNMAEFVEKFKDLNILDRQIQSIYNHKEPYTDLAQIYGYYLSDCCQDKDNCFINFKDMIFCYEVDINMFNKIAARYANRANKYLSNIIIRTESEVLTSIKIIDALKIKEILSFANHNLEKTYFLNGGYKFTPINICLAHMLDIRPDYQVINILDNMSITSENYICPLNDTNFYRYIYGLTDLQQREFILWITTNHIQCNILKILVSLIKLKLFDLAEICYEYWTYQIVDINLITPFDYSFNINNLTVKELFYLHTKYPKFPFRFLVDCFGTDQLDVQFKVLSEFIDMTQYLPVGQIKFDYSNIPQQLKQFNEFYNFQFEFRLPEDENLKNYDIYIIQNSKLELSSDDIPKSKLTCKFIECAKILIHSKFNFSMHIRFGSRTSHAALAFIISGIHREY